MLPALYVHLYSKQEDEKSILRSYLLINRGFLTTSIYLKKTHSFDKQTKVGFQPDVLRLLYFRVVRNL